MEGSLGWGMVSSCSNMVPRCKITKVFVFPEFLLVGRKYNEAGASEAVCT